MLTAEAHSDAQLIAIATASGVRLMLNSPAARQLVVAREGDEGWRSSHIAVSSTATQPKLAEPDGLHVVHTESEPDGYVVLVHALSRKSVEAKEVLRVKLAEDKRPVAHGPTALPMPQGWAVPYGTSDAGGVVYASAAAKPQERKLPPGKLIASLPATPPRLLLQRKAANGFVELVQTTIPAPDDPWPREVTAEVLYTPELETTGISASACGTEREPYFALAGRSSNGGVLAALASRDAYSFRAKLLEDSQLIPLCGACPPAALQTSAEGLSMLLPVRRKLAAQSVTQSARYRGGKVAATCTSNSYVIAYVSDGEVLVQRTDSGGWRFQEPRVLARPNALGTPSDVQLVSAQSRVIAIWKRVGGNELRVEATTSSDGGTTWR